MSSSATSSRSTVRDVFRVALRLGCSSFGGPVAHLGYFHQEYIVRRRWLTEQEYAELLALAQTLPGPASSQVGFMIGLLRAGWLGGAAAWLGFTLPSALLMIAFAAAHNSFNGPIAAATLHGLQIAAVAVIAQAILTMRRVLAPDLRRLLLALLAVPIALFAPSGVSSLACIAFGAIAGLTLLRNLPRPAAAPALDHQISTRSAIVALTVMVLLLIALPVSVGITGNHIVAVASAFYRSGALVFGGGHVVLPLLENATVLNGWLSQSTFLSGYGAAQALPGPFFSLAAYLGYSLTQPPNGIAGALLALAGIFLPGMLLAAGTLPFWSRLTRSPRALAMFAGINASVIGLLAAALYRPAWTGAIHTLVDIAVLLLALVALLRFKLAPWIVLLGTVALTLVLTRFGLMH